MSVFCSITPIIYRAGGNKSTPKCFHRILSGGNKIVVKNVKSPGERCSGDGTSARSGLGVGYRRPRLLRPGVPTRTTRPLIADVQVVTGEVRRVAQLTDAEPRGLGRASCHDLLGAGWHRGRDLGHHVDELVVTEASGLAPPVGGVDGLDEAGVIVSHL